MSTELRECCTSSSDIGNGKDYDLAVIGAGSAGFSAAITAADQGARVALIGYGTIGGTCVNVGCLPSKTLIRATETLHQAHAAQRFAGIHVQASVASWPAVVAQKDALVSELRQAKYLDLLAAYDSVRYLEGPARLTPEGVAVNGDLINAGKIIVTTGSLPSVPPIPGLETVPYLTSTTAMALERLSESLLVIGAGYVGCELAQMFARAGVKVTLLCRRRLLPEAEPEISEALTGFFRDEGIEVVGGVAYQAVRATSNGVAATFTRNGKVQTLEAHHLLNATGRRANTEGLGLEEADVELDTNGSIRVDGHLRTTNRRIYAAGDVTGSHQFVYMAAYGAKIAAENALNGDTKVYDASAMPSVVFTDPQVASVGWTEAEARAEGRDVQTSILPLSAVPRALAARDTRGLIKLVADRETGRLLGAHILAPEGSDSIQTAVLAIKHGLTVTELADTLFPYLTTVEGLKLAAQTFSKDVSKLSCCAG